MRRRVARVAAVGLVGLAAATGLAAVAQGVMAARPTPRMIPAPQRWTPRSGLFAAELVINAVGPAVA